MSNLSVVGLLDHPSFFSSSRLSKAIFDGVDEQGRVWIREEESSESALEARLTGAAQRLLTERPAEMEGREVVVWYEGGQKNRPVVIDFLFERVLPSMERDHSPTGAEEVVIRGKNVVLEADESLRLRCGPTQILMKRVGRLLMRGKHLSSRSSGSNIIKGSSVKIN